MKGNLRLVSAISISLALYGGTFIPAVFVGGWIVSKPDLFPHPFLHKTIDVSLKLVGKTNIIAGTAQNVYPNHSPVVLNDLTLRPEMT
jgi:hypothetical protein